MVRKERISGLLYSGVGLGIFQVVSLFLFTSVNTWKTTWVLLGIFH